MRGGKKKQQKKMEAAHLMVPKIPVLLLSDLSKTNGNSKGRIFFSGSIKYPLAVGAFQNEFEKKKKKRNGRKKEAFSLESNS
jgi:hypothetical protein